MIDDFDIRGVGTLPTKLDGVSGVGPNVIAIVVSRSQLDQSIRFEIGDVLYRDGIVEKIKASANGSMTVKGHHGQWDLLDPLLTRSKFSLLAKAFDGHPSHPLSSVRPQSYHPAA
jgi:hypothetical protein